MKLFGALAMMTAAVGWSGEASQDPRRVVMVCMKAGENTMMMFRGEAIAAHILKQAGVRLEWKSDERPCANGSGFVINVSRQTPVSRYPRALAYAMPFEDAHIVLFYDRVLTTAAPAVTPYLLGYVLAHEIVHMLQGIEQHSNTGVMKEKWGAGDYADMQLGRLRLTEGDVDLVRKGLQARSRNSTQAE